MKVIIYFNHNRHRDDYFKVYAFTESKVKDIEEEITLWASDFFGEDLVEGHFGEDLVEGQPINNPSISMPYDFAMGSEDYCRGYFIKNLVQ